MARITSRDFKRTRPGALRFDLSRWREFGIGLAVGLSLSVCVLIWQNYREKTAASAVPETPRPEPRAAAPAEAEETGKNFDFYDRPEYVGPAIAKIDAFLKQHL